MQIAEQHTQLQIAIAPKVRLCHPSHLPHDSSKSQCHFLPLILTHLIYAATLVLSALALS